MEEKMSRCQKQQQTVTHRIQVLNSKIYNILTKNKAFLGNKFCTSTVYYLVDKI